MTSETTNGVGILQQIAEALGDGWTADRNGEADGDLRGPNGENLSVDARAFNEGASAGRRYHAYLHLRTAAPDDLVNLDGETREGETLADFILRLSNLLPHWQRKHADDLAKVAEILAPAAAFAAEVAAHLGDGWTGGAADSHGNRDRLSPVAYVTHGPLRVEWEPGAYGYRYDPRRSATKLFTPAQRFSIRGTRERWPARTSKENPSITVAANRPAKQIAGEIKRRILPGYLEALQDADQEDARHAASVSGLEGTVAMVLRAGAGLGLREKWYGQDSSWERKALTFYTNLRDGHSLSGEVSCTANTVTVELKAYTMDPETAKVLLQALASAAKKLAPQEPEG